MTDWVLRDRESGETHNLGKIPESQPAKVRALDGMVWKIDFERYELLEVEAAGSVRSDAGNG